MNHKWVCDSFLPKSGDFLLKNIHENLECVSVGKSPRLTLIHWHFQIHKLQQERRCTWGVVSLFFPNFHIEEILVLVFLKYSKVVHNNKELEDQKLQCFQLLGKGANLNMFSAWINCFLTRNKPHSIIGFKDREVVFQMFCMNRTLQNNHKIQVKVSLCKRKLYYND